MPSSSKAFPLVMVLIIPQSSCLMIEVVKVSSMSRLNFIKIEAKTTSLYLAIFIEVDHLMYRL
jgi:hypothetical protein